MYVLLWVLKDLHMYRLSADCNMCVRHNRFLLMADFDAYVKCQERVSEVFQVSLKTKVETIRTLISNV